MKKIILLLVVATVCFTNAMAQDSTKNCQYSDNEALQNLIKLSNFPQNMVEVANGLDENGYTPIYDYTMINSLDDKINKFDNHDIFILRGKNGEFAYTFIGMEVIYQREVHKKNVFDDTKLLVHAQDTNGNFIDLIMRPTNYQTIYELQENKKIIIKDTLPFLIVEEGNNMYTISCSNDDLFSVFDREIATYIAVVLTLKNY